MTTHSVDLFAAAVEAYQRGDFVEARLILEKAALASSTHAETHHLLAVLLARESRFNEAGKHFLTAIHSAPNRHDFCCNYALFLHDTGESERAVDLFTQVLQARPNFAPAHNGLGSALFKLGNLASSEAAFRQAVRLQPENAQHHNNLANLLKESGKASEAISCYRKALSIFPDYAEAHLNLGIVLKEQGQTEGAQASFQRALEIRPNYEQARLQLEQVADFWSEPLIGRSVVLRGYAEHHASFLYETFRNRRFMGHYNRMIPADEPLTKLVAALRKSEKSLPWSKLSVDWVICKRDLDGAEIPIGLANFAALDMHNRKAEYLIGIVNEQDHHPRFALEANLLAMDFAFNKARLNKITSVVYEGNNGAQSLTLDLGFTQEGFRPRHMRVEGAAYLGLYENGMNVEAFRANRRLAMLSKRWLGHDVTQ